MVETSHWDSPIIPTLHPTHSCTSCPCHPCASLCGQRSRDELFLFRHVHPDMVSERFSSCFYQGLEKLSSFFTCLLSFSDLGFPLLHTLNHWYNTPHTAHVNTRTPNTNLPRTSDLSAYHQKQERGQPGEVYSGKCQPPHVATFLSQRDEHG